MANPHSKKVVIFSAPTDKVLSNADKKKQAKWNRPPKKRNNSFLFQYMIKDQTKTMKVITTQKNHFRNHYISKNF